MDLNHHLRFWRPLDYHYRKPLYGAQGGSRTRKTTVLSRVPMPIRLLGHAMVQAKGVEPLILSANDPKSLMYSSSNTPA